MDYKPILKHPLQKHIVSVLTSNEKVRFSDLRLPGYDTNLVTYHLKLLIKNGFVCKVGRLYTLDAAGVTYVNQTNILDKSHEVLSMLLIQNSDGGILLKRRKKQPYINTWTLPYCRIGRQDSSIHEQAHRCAADYGVRNTNLKRIGDCYIRIRQREENISSTFVHVFRGEIDMDYKGDSMRWVHPRRLASFRLSPGIEQVISRSFFGDEYFFEEFDYQWSTSTT